MTLSSEEKDLYKQLENLLEQGEGQTKFVINLKRSDSQDTGYLSQEMIVRALQDTYGQMKPTGQQWITPD